MYGIGIKGIEEFKQEPTPLPKHVQEIKLTTTSNPTTPSLFVKKLTPTAKLPIRATPQSAGLDLFADGYFTIEPGSRKKIGTGIAMQIPQKYMGHICPRSGLALNHGIDIGAGIVDNDYGTDLKTLQDVI